MKSFSLRYEVLCDANISLVAAIYLMGCYVLRFPRGPLGYMWKGTTNLSAYFLLAISLPSGYELTWKYF